MQEQFKKLILAARTNLSCETDKIQLQRHLATILNLIDKHGKKLHVERVHDFHNKK